MKVTLNRQLLGLEDLLFGAGTVEQIRGGQTVTITKVNASNLPFGVGDETFIEVIEGYITEAEAQAQIATDAANSITSLTVVGVPGLVADATYDTLTNTITFTLPQGAQGIPGPESTVPGPQGDSITAVTSSKVGKTTTVEVYVEGALENTFTVLDGNDGTGIGDMLKATYDTTGNGIVDASETAPWSGISGKPATFPPEAHYHDDRYFTETEITSTLTGYSLTSHSHTKTDVGLSNVDNTSDANKPVSIATQTALNLKADTTALTTKQDTLVSGINIKTLGGSSILGSGDIEITAFLQTSLEKIDRASNTSLINTDTGKFINITSGTFTQTFSSVSTLGNGWFCYIKNSGTGDITLDPDGSELIDGLTSYVMYPNEVRLIMCNGTSLSSVVLSAFYKVFTSSGTFIKPPNYSKFNLELWGGGAGGGTGVNSYGGSGGGYTGCYLNSSNIPVSVSVSIGAGGAARTGSNLTPNPGGSTTFGSLLAALGATVGDGGGGFGFSPSSYALVGSPAVACNAARGSHTSTLIQVGMYGGSTSTRDAFASQNIYGAGCGQSIDNSIVRAIGLSLFGGNGGEANIYGSGSNGIAPGGGGGATVTSTSPSGAGANGEVRIMGVI